MGNMPEFLGVVGYAMKRYAFMPLHGIVVMILLLCGLQSSFAQSADPSRSAFGFAGLYLGMNVREMTTVVKTTSWSHRYPLLTGNGDSNAVVTLRSDLMFAPEDVIPPISTDSGGVATLACGSFNGKAACANVAWVLFTFHDTLVSQMYFRSDALGDAERVGQYGRLALQGLTRKLGRPGRGQVKGMLPSWKRLKQLRRSQELRLATWHSGDDLAILGIIKDYHDKYSYFIRMIRSPR